MVDDTIKGVKSLWEDAKSLQHAANGERLNKIKEDLLKKGSMEEQVYDLCDGTNTISDITRNLNKPLNNIRVAMTNLLRKGIISYLEYDGEKIII